MQNTCINGRGLYIYTGIHIPILVITTKHSNYIITYIKLHYFLTWQIHWRKQNTKLNHIKSLISSWPLPLNLKHSTVSGGVQRGQLPPDAKL